VEWDHLFEKVVGLRPPERHSAQAHNDACNKAVLRGKIGFIG
jgi:hypothetical protein